MPNSESWFTTRLGHAILSLEQAQINHWLSGLFGYHLVAISDSLTQNDLTTRKIPHCYISPSSFSKKTPCQLYADASDLPFASNSVDCLLLHHQLEFLPEPRQALIEAERVLISHGQLIIIGFNPHSLFGLWRRLTRKKALYPWSGRFHSMALLKQLLMETELSIEETQYFFYKLPRQRRDSLKKWRLLDILGAKLWPARGAIYALRIRKKTLSRITPLNNASLQTVPLIVPG